MKLFSFCLFTASFLLTGFYLHASSINLTQTSGCIRVLGDDQPNNFSIHISQGTLRVVGDTENLITIPVDQVHTVFIQGFQGSDQCLFSTDQAYDADRIIAALNTDDNVQTVAWFLFGHDVTIVANVEQFTTTVHR